MARHYDQRVERRFARLMSVVNGLVSLLGVVYAGVVFGFMWEWFVPLPPVGLWRGIGMVLMAKLMFTDYSHLMDKYLDEVFDDEPGRRLLWELQPTFVITSAIWFMGWVAHARPWEWMK